MLNQQRIYTSGVISQIPKVVFSTLFCTHQFSQTVSGQDTKPTGMIDI